MKDKTRSPKSQRGGPGRVAGRPRTLREFLASPGRPKDALGYFEVHGFLFALVGAPELVPPSEWLPVVFGSEKPPFDGPKQAERLLEDAMQLYNRLSEQARTDRVELPEGCALREDVLANFDEDAPIAQWAVGFHCGYSWVRDSWDVPLAPDDDERIHLALTTLMLFSSRRAAEGMIQDGTVDASLEELARQACHLFLPSMGLYAETGLSLARAALARPQAPASPRVGRNDPCPCGSGKKLKKCCRSQPADLMERAATRIREVQQRVERQLLRELDELPEEIYDDARFEFACGFDELEREERENQLFVPWQLYSWAPYAGSDSEADDRSIAERFLDANVRRLAADEADFIRRVSATPNSFHEVLEVEPGRRLKLRDIVLETQHDVFERMGSVDLRVGQLVYGRVVSFDGVSLILGLGAFPLQPIDKLPVISIRKRLREFGGPTSEQLRSTDRQLRTLYLQMRDTLLNPRPPILKNTSGETLEFHTITCEISSPARAFDALAPLARGMRRGELLADAELDADGQVVKVEVPWFKSGRRKGESGDAVFGVIDIDGPRLTAEVNSHARARRLQKELQKRLGEEMTNLTIRIKSLEEAMAEARLDEDSPEEQQRREEEQRLRDSPEAREAIRQLQRRHRETWIDESLPALRGLTPRQAVKDPDGREMVQALLRQFEEQAMPDEAPDFDRVRRALGLAPRGSS